MVGDPLLPDPAAIFAPARNGTAFADGSATIRQAFLRLVADWAAPIDGSPLFVRLHLHHQYLRRCLASTA